MNQEFGVNLLDLIEYEGDVASIIRPGRAFEPAADEVPETGDRQEDQGEGR
jgi:hypothetical protein